MVSLTEVKKGSLCKVLWMIGQNCSYLKEHFHINEEEDICGINNMDSGLMISHDGRSIAVSSDVAREIKVAVC